VKIYIGTSGWIYKHWRKVFYPEGLPQTKWLEFYTQHFSTVEINNTFYQLPSEKTFTGWRERSSPDFAYAVKISRFITHLKKLRNVEEALGNFFSRAQLLGEKLGPLLYQLPPNMPRNDAVLGDFLQLLLPGLHHVFEFRHESWFDEEIFDLLHKHKAGFCIFDMPDLTTPVIATTDFAYIRFHGSSGLYSSCYADTELEEWAERIGSLGKDLKAIYIYFNNDAEGFAISNAKTLREKFRTITEKSR
jgi:uncharacterized protein YecE (DUF72 family)